MNCVSCDICMYHLWFVCVFPGVFLSSRVTEACPATTDLIMRVNVRTTTTCHIDMYHRTKNCQQKKGTKDKYCAVFDTSV